MFDIGWSEMLVILVVALIVIGPKDLPRVARTVGQWVGKARRLAREFQTQLEDMARETEFDKVKQEIERAGRTDVRRSIEKTIDPKGELSRAFDPTETSGKRRPETPAEPPVERVPSLEPAAAVPAPPSEAPAREKVPAEPR